MRARVIMTSFFSFFSLGTSFDKVLIEIKN